MFGLFLYFVFPVPIDYIRDKVCKIKGICCNATEEEIGF